MKHLLLPWLEMAILIPLLGGIWLARVREPHTARKWSLVFSGFTASSRNSETLGAAGTACTRRTFGSAVPRRSSMPSLPPQAASNTAGSTARASKLRRVFMLGVLC